MVFSCSRDSITALLGPRRDFSCPRISYRLLGMEDEKANESARIRAHSPGEFPILVVELPSGGLRAVYFETAYDLGRAKAVDEDWLSENAVGRHSFVEVDPPVEIPAMSLEEYVRRV